LPAERFHVYPFPSGLEMIDLKIIDSSGHGTPNTTGAEKGGNMPHEIAFAVNLQADAQDVIGTNVRKVQYLLRERGYSLVPDGFYGLRTEGKVREFQAHEDMRIDGVVGSKTWNALTVVVGPGDRGDAVRAVQIQFASLKRDGFFGPRTLSRVRRFQKECGLKVDGVVGRRTWSALTISPMLDLEREVESLRL